MDNILIVYYISINICKDWKCIVKGQLNDLKKVGLSKCKFFIAITGENIELINSCIELINEYKLNNSIFTNTENLYEYSGIKLMHEISHIYEDKIILYMHTKGMVFNNPSNFRSNDELIILRYTIKDYKKILKLFENKSINKIGLFPSPEGKIMFNFFWIRSNYFKDKPAPIIKNVETYYEDYICFDNIINDDCYSLMNNSISSFDILDIISAMDNIKQSLEYKILTMEFNLENYKFYYGIENNKCDITKNVIDNCLFDSIITIPSGDLKRAQLFGDPIPGTFKYIYINDKSYNINSVIYINLLTSIIYQVDELPDKIKEITTYHEHITEKLEKSHSKLKINHGDFKGEYPEQYMSIKYITGNEKVLEIGSNIGRNTLLISSLLNDSSNLVTLESDIDIYNQLIENKNLNNFYFHAENSALSKRKLIQKNWETIPSEELLDGCKWVNTITYIQLKNKYQIDFDTLVIDCEGAFYYILQDMPEILNGINLIIMENDYWDYNHKKYIDSILKNNGFYLDFYKQGGWGPCYNHFYETWKR
jgi:FkbM family methyltransferase